MINLPLILLVGFKGSGKNTAAEFLISSGYIPLSFADSIKDTVASVFCWERSMLEGDTIESRKWRETIDPWWSKRLGIPNFTPRFAMQNIGTEVMRESFHNNIWILNVERRIENISKNENNHQGIVLIDGRHKNEVAMARKHKAKIIRIKRGSEPDWYETAILANAGDKNAQDDLEHLGIHSSEYSWIGLVDTKFGDTIISNDATPEKLGNKILGAISEV